MTDQTEAPGLLPCPFCGGKDLYHSGADTEKGYVICDRCGTYGPEATRGSWNDRAALDRVKAEARREERERIATWIEAAGTLLEGDLRIDVELVMGGWVGYVWLTPAHGPIVPAERDSFYARTSAQPSRQDALDALPEAFDRIKAAAIRAEAERGKG